MWRLNTSSICALQMNCNYCSVYPYDSFWWPLKLFTRDKHRKQLGEPLLPKDTVWRYCSEKFYFHWWPVKNTVWVQILFLSHTLMHKQLKRFKIITWKFLIVIYGIAILDYLWQMTKLQTFKYWKIHQGSMWENKDLNYCENESSVRLQSFTQSTFVGVQKGWWNLRVHTCLLFQSSLSVWAHDILPLQR